MRMVSAGWIVVVAMVVVARPGIAATPEAVRERLAKVAAGSRALMGKAEALPEKDAKQLWMVAAVPEDRAGEVTKQFARASEVAGYVRLRPWSVAYGNRSGGMWPGVSVEGRPVEGDAGALRELLKDRDGEVRSLAVEALGALALPEDVGRIGGLLGDETAGAVVLGWSRQQSSMAWVSFEANPLVPERSWHERTVGTYAREALRVMTGHRFDGKDPAGVTFAEWWRTHDLGKESLWYWQQRLTREQQLSVVMIERHALVKADGEVAARREATDAGRQKALHEATVAELQALPLDVQWKIFLLTGPDVSGEDVTGPVNPFFPEGLVNDLPAWRLRELTEGTHVWPEVADVVGGRGLMLARLARMADQITLGYGAPMVFKEALAKAIEREAAGARWRPVLVSRLMLPAAADRLDDPKFRAGYLRQALAEATEGYAREMISEEMVRDNLEAQWPVLEKVFYSEQSRRGETSDARIGVLKALGEAPHTKEKARRLTELIADPRNEELFTQENRVMGMDMYRYWAIRGVDAIAGKKVVPREVEEGFKDARKAKWALGELRRLVSGLSSATTAGEEHDRQRQQ